MTVMRRYRLVIAAALILLVGGIVVWFWANRLTANEQTLVGTWRCVWDRPDNATIWILDSGHRWHAKYAFAPGGAGGERVGRWSIQGDRLCLAPEPSGIRRAIQPLARLVGIRIDVPTDPNGSYRLKSVSDDCFVIEATAPVVYTYERVR